MGCLLNFVGNNLSPRINTCGNRPIRATAVFYALGRELIKIIELYFKLTITDNRNPSIEDIMHRFIIFRICLLPTCSYLTNVGELLVISYYLFLNIL